MLREETLPSLYDKWIRELLGRGVPKEERATCQSCPMVRSSSGDGEAKFSSETKCCTYTPDLPNFLAGLVLADDDTAAATGRATLRARIERRTAVTPLSVGIPPSTAQVYGATGDSVFGRSLALRCPHYVADVGRCSIWKHRNSVCMTWFCRYVRGPIGHQFWMQTKELFRAVESQLALLCAEELLGDSEQLIAVLAESRAALPERLADELVGPSSDRYAALWGSWTGREEEFFVKCSRLAG